LIKTYYIDSIIPMDDDLFKLMAHTRQGESNRKFIEQEIKCPFMSLNVTDVEISLSN
jgi:hypothetical protein